MQMSPMLPIYVHTHWMHASRCYTSRTPNTRNNAIWKVESKSSQATIPAKFRGPIACIWKALIHRSKKEMHKRYTNDGHIVRHKRNEQHRIYDNGKSFDKKKGRQMVLHSILCTWNAMTYPSKDRIVIVIAISGTTFCAIILAPLFWKTDAAYCAMVSWIIINPNAGRMGPFWREICSSHWWNTLENGSWGIKTNACSYNI